MRETFIFKQKREKGTENILKFNQSCNMKKKSFYSLKKTKIKRYEEHLDVQVGAKIS